LNIYKETSFMISRSTFSLERAIFSVFLSLCFGISAAFAQVTGLPAEAVETNLGGGNAIVGTVLTPSNQRIETRIQVRLSTPSRGDRTAVTDERGTFAFKGLTSGTYYIIIDKENQYEPVNQVVDIIQVRGFPPQVYSLNIRLKLKPNAEAKPAVINSEFANVPKPAMALYTKAAELVQKEDYRGAIEQMKLAIAEYPDFMMAYNEMGVQYMRLGDLERADEAFQTALKIKPEAFAPTMNRGIVLVHMKRYKEAEPVLRSAKKMKDNLAVVHYFLGQALANLGNFDEAEKELSAAVKLGGEEMKEAHRILAIIYNVKGDKKRAAEELEAYLRVAPKAPDAEQLRKVIQQLKGEN
jgi:Flp pilus assembly protein TadD